MISSSIMLVSLEVFPLKYSAYLCNWNDQKTCLKESTTIIMA